VNEHLSIWNALGKTDPAHTKEFKKGGGFAGTAVRPIYSIRRMTDLFGPCGIGWGMTEPTYRVEPIVHLDEILVFCTVGLWFVNAYGERSLPIYGVGGDKVLSKDKNGPRVSDEAFKAAYTDALGNAMKHLGMSADIHMGLFEDHKYLRDLKAEFAAERQAPASPPPPPVPETPKTDEVRKRIEDKEQAEKIKAELRVAQSPDEIDRIRNDVMFDYFKSARPDIYRVLDNIAENARSALLDVPF
jgi:hypothetical protein